MSKILFVGASGVVAQKLIPGLSAEHDIIGVSRSNAELAHLCREHHKIDLLQEGPVALGELFQTHAFDVVIWNVVAYFQRPLLESSREILHTEFDFAVALPLECLKYYVQSTAPHKKRFIAIASQSAYGHRANLSSYAIVKRAEINLIEHAAAENIGVVCIGLAPAHVPRISTERMTTAAEEAFTTEMNGLVIKVDEDLPHS